MLGCHVIFLSSFLKSEIVRSPMSRPILLSSISTIASFTSLPIFTEYKSLFKNLSSVYGYTLKFLFNDKYIDNEEIWIKDDSHHFNSNFHANFFMKKILDELSKYLINT